MKSSSLASVLLISCLISMVSLFCYGSDNKPTLIVFSADWCSFCQKAKHDINNDNELSEIVKHYYVVIADFDVDKDLVDGYNVKTIPTFVVITGNVVTKKVGYNGVKDLTKFLK
jgi:thioredoxin-related protein